ncbi:MAG: YkgJ family cysteine cluster protein [Planctomycetota bacterium]
MNAPSDNSCEDCGICCFAFSLPPFDANELVRAPEALLQQVDEYARSKGYRETDPCLWLDLDSRKCRHHDMRPVLCRWFEPGGLACNELRAEAGLAKLEKVHRSRVPR